MTMRATKERLRDEISLWFADGIIDEPTLGVLQERYESRRFGWIGVVKYLGICGGLLTAMGILGSIAAAVESGVFAALLLGGAGAAGTYWGIRMADDREGRYAVSSKVVLTLGVVCWTGAIGVLAYLMGMKDEQGLLATGVVALPIGFTLAYRYRNAYLLIVALLAFFHWIGSWHAMWGNSAYVFSVQDPKTMSLVALAAVAAGIYHERRLYPRTGRFYLAWEALGLVYLNMSLLILSIWGHHEAGTVGWIAVFTAATLVQIAAGAALQNRLIRGFGIVFFAVDIFTRYHEFFWERLNLGLFLLVGGGILALLGAYVEVVTRMARRWWKGGT